MTTVYAMSCRPLLQPALLAQAQQRLSAECCTRIARAHTLLAKAQHAGAWLLVTHLLGVNGQLPAITYTAHGKPLLADGRAGFNLSHSGEWVFCAVSDGAVGLDAQQTRPLSPGTLRRCFSAQEQTWAAAHRDGAIRLWTRKEAYGKYTGEGLRMPIAAVRVPLSPEEMESHPLFWQEFRQRDICITLCAEKPAAAYTVLPSLPALDRQ